VRRALGNPRYRGWWEYGVTENVWQSKKDYSRQVVRPEPLRSAHFEDLRIVSDELWYAAQKQLADEAQSSAGRKPRDGDRSLRPRLLNGLFRCPAHEQILYVGGVHGRYMFCKACKGLKPQQRPLYSQLPRQLALQLTCQKLATLVEGDEDLVAQVLAACRQEAARAQRPDPNRLEELQKRGKQLDGKIQFLLRNVGESEQDQRESAESLKAFRRERADVQTEISRLEAAAGQPIIVPDAAEVRALLRNLGDVLAVAAEGSSEEGAAAREVIELLTGGRIDLYQMGERKAQRGWLQGRFRVRLLPYLTAKLTGFPCGNLETLGAEVVIDYREPAACEAEAERAKALYDQGLLSCQIAAVLGCNRNWVTKLLKHWFASRGLAMPDGRMRRAGLPRKQAGLPLYEQLAEAAKGLWDAGLAEVQIAARLGCSPPTAAAAVTSWHTAPGLPAPSHAGRRTALVDQMKALYDRGLPLREIAREVDLCGRSVTLLLRERFASLGQAMPDGRTRRAASEAKPMGFAVGQVEATEPPPELGGGPA
jgi:hypothetical protein